MFRETFENNKFSILIYGKNGFTKIYKILARYRFKNNFIRLSK